MKTIPTLTEFMALFIQNRTRTRKDSVIKSYKQISNKTLLPLFGHMRVDEIGTYEYDRLERRCEELGHSVKTILEHRGVLIICLRYAWYLKLRAEPEKPAPLERPEYENKKPMSQEAVAKLLAHIDNPDVYDMACMALRVGLRIGEMRCLTWEHFESLDPEWRVKISQCFSGQYSVLDKCKGKEKRTLRIWPDMVEVLKRRKHRSKYVFFDSSKPSRIELPMPYDVAHHSLVAAAKRAGVWVKEFGFHALRHTYATELAKVDGMTAFRLQGLMGHRHISTSMRYIAMQSRDIEGECDPLAESCGNQSPYRPTLHHTAK